MTRQIEPASMIEVGRSSVQAWECDVIGHLNSQYYVERAIEAGTVLLARLGCGTRSFATHGLRLTALDQHMRFLSELRVWRSYAMRAGIVVAGPERLTIYCEIIEDVTQRVSAAITTSYGVRSLADGRPSRLPDAIAAHAAAQAVEIPIHGRPRGLAPTVPIAAGQAAPSIRATMRMTATGVVKPGECDEHGWLLPRYFTSHFINGITALQLPEPSSADAGDPVPKGAAVENRVIYRRYPRAGDAVVIHSAITAAAERSYNWVHWMFDAEDGELVASNEAVAICMDMAARKAIALPDRFRRDLASRLNGKVAI